MYSHKLTKRNAEQIEASVSALADTVQRLARKMKGSHAESIAELAERHEERTRKILKDSEVR